MEESEGGGRAALPAVMKVCVTDGASPRWNARVCNANLSNLSNVDPNLSISPFALSVLTLAQSCNEAWRESTCQRAEVVH